MRRSTGSPAPLIMKNRLAILIVLMALAEPCIAAASPQAGDPLNAATWYRRARERERAAGISPDEWMTIHFFDSDTLRPPTPQVRMLIGKLQPAINLTRRGARLQHSDFGVDYTDPDERESAIADCRALGRHLRHDFSVRLHDGDYRTAVDRIVTAYRLAGHVSRDACQSSMFNSFRSMPSTDMLPSVGSYILPSNLISVVLPEPFTPMMAIFSPGLIVNERLRSTSGLSPDSTGYLNDTLLKEMRGGLSKETRLASSLETTFGFSSNRSNRREA